MIERIYNDRLLESLLGLSAYFFLVFILLGELGRSSCLAQILFLATVFLFAARILYLLVRKKNRAGPHRGFRGMNIFRNAVVFIAYWALIAVILGPDFRYVWSIYTLIAFRAGIAAVALISIRRK